MAPGGVSRLLIPGGLRHFSTDRRRSRKSFDAVNVRSAEDLVGLLEQLSVGLLLLNLN